MNVLLVLVLALVPLVAEVRAADGSPSSAGNTVKADVLYWEGDEVIVKDVSGHEVRLHVSPETKIEGVAGGRLKSGDKIVATVTPDGHAQSIVLQLPDGGGGFVPPGGR